MSEVKPELRQCSKCHSTCTLEHFEKNRKGEWFKLCNNCRKCKREYDQDNRDEILYKKWKYRENNKDKIQQSQKEYCENNKDQIIERKQIKRDELREKMHQDKLKRFMELKQRV